MCFDRLILLLLNLVVYVRQYLGLYRRCGMDVVNYLLSQKILAILNKKENRPGLVNPLAYYLRYT